MIGTRDVKAQDFNILDYSLKKDSAVTLQWKVAAKNANLI